MRPSTILLTALTAVFGIATIVLAIVVGPGNTGGFIAILRLGGLVTIGFGAGLLITVTNRRRRERLRGEADAHPGTVFVNAHAVGSTTADLEAWSPGLAVRFPCDLGFDHEGMTAWSSRDRTKEATIATREEITGFDVFDERTPLGSTSRWGITVNLAPKDAGPGRVRLLMIDEQRNQDERTMRDTIARIEAALGS